MNSTDRTKYSETDLIDVLNRMFNIEELEAAAIAKAEKERLEKEKKEAVETTNGSTKKAVDPDFNRLTIEATESIIEKIFQFKNSAQRIGYLNYLLKKFFNDGKGYAISSIAKPLQDAFYKKTPKKVEKKNIQYQYIRECYSALHYLLEEVSEHCLVYPDIDFHGLLNRNFKVHNVSPFYIFVVYSNPKTPVLTDENNQNNGGRPKKEIDETMNLETILHEGLYSDAKKYYQTKLEKGKLKFFTQYGQLIREFDKKDWIKPEYKKLSPEQMKILIFNEFNVTVSRHTARKDPKGNEFEDIQKRKTLQLPM